MNEKLLRFWEIIRVDDPELSAAADGDPTPSVVDPSVEPQADPPPAPPTPAMVPVDVMRRRVDVLTRRNADLERELELARLGQQLDPAPATPPTPRQPANVGLEARALAEQMRREDKAQAVIAAGNGLAPDFMIRVNTMNQMLGQLPNEFLDAVMDAGEDDAGAAQLLYDLSQDLQRAGSIAVMSPTKMAVELTKFRAGRKAPVAKPSAPSRPAAPAPIEPKVTGGRAAAVPGDLSDPNMDIDAWMKARQEGASASRRY